ncbi:MAG: cobaltochelatase subunit CobN [Alphaproteobacteria bacterium]|nr:cobaltochelatase subunit CobN [Alphaproteobacteria bacterium]
MHLLEATQGVIADGGEAIDLGQTPGDLVVLSAADSEIACLAAAYRRVTERHPGAPSLRLASLLQLSHNMSVDLHIDKVMRHARLVVVRLLGGRGYWPYGVERLAAAARANGFEVAFLPGDDRPDAELMALSTIPGEACHRLWQYCVHGGVDNAAWFLAYAAELIGQPLPWQEPTPLLRAGLYWPDATRPDLDAVRAHWRAGDPRAPVALLLFYRALVQAGNLAAVDALIAALAARGINPLPVYVTSLKDAVAAATVESMVGATSPDIVLNATAFAVGEPGAAAGKTPLAATDAPVLQVIFASGGETAWRQSTRGLGPRDVAMHVALPEVDGRILARAVSFKGRNRRDEASEADIVSYQPVADRIEFTADLARAWTRLRSKPRQERRIACVLANYPNRDGRIGNGVGLDTPASALVVLQALAEAGYTVEAIPATPAELLDRLLEGPTNDLRAVDRIESESLSLADYQIFLATLPTSLRARINERWGAPERDPAFREGRLDCGRFVVPAIRLGQIVVAIQPARGYNIDPTASYHSPDLVPPHNYLAFYAWLRDGFRADAIVHLGKHGNLEWLPGKALALSAECFPEAALGPLPHLYPFIVNDPGEGSQAKRRAQAVIVDHLTPPLTRAESYGPLRDLEALVDEYYEAASVDTRRLGVLGRQILDHATRIGLAEDCGIARDDAEAAALGKLDGYLCELKELQIRDGLHVFGRAPEGRLLTDLLAALARVPRHRGKDADASLTRALAADLGLDFDPLDCAMAAPWNGPRPTALQIVETPWRSTGDTVERLELLAVELIAGTRICETGWTRCAAVLGWIEEALRPAVARCGTEEMAGLLRGLDGRFVSPGPSGAPTRGRPDVLPTGRNFYSLDTRTVPTPAAWHLGWKSAGLLLERHAQEHGDWPRQVALSVWGTSNMRTGGDDIAQALAMLGVRPTWDQASRRVTGFEILPVSVLGRPRVDVILRVSGFFRDAFANLIDLFDSAVRAVAALDEAEADNPLAARVRAQRATLIAQGVAPELAAQRAGYRIFGSMPGAYGAGLQALIDEGGWADRSDLAAAYVAWGGYAYGAGAEGVAAREEFSQRLAQIDAVLHNQDNREHDLLDSDDYYQFEGGLAAAVCQLSGKRPAIYHNDHSRPESPRIRTLDQEIARVVRGRAANPKWIAGVMRHGYKGAFEMAATVDYLFAFAATTGAVRDHHFDAVYAAYLGDESVRQFIADNNPAALREMAERFLEAQERGLWRSRANHVHVLLARLAGRSLPATGGIEHERARRRRS